MVPYCGTIQRTRELCLHRREGGKAKQDGIVSSSDSFPGINPSVQQRPHDLLSSKRAQFLILLHEGLRSQHFEFKFEETHSSHNRNANLADPRESMTCF